MRVRWIASVSGTALLLAGAGGSAAPPAKTGKATPAAKRPLPKGAAALSPGGIPKPAAIDGAGELAATVGPLRLVVERVVQNASLTLDFAPEMGDAAPVDGRQTIYIHLAVSGPDRDLVSGIVGLSREITANTDTGQKVVLRSYTSSDGGSPDGKTWRTYVLAHDVELKARALRNVSGDVMVYPRSRAVRLDFPLKEKSPQTRAAEGLRVTLQEARWENKTLSVTLRQEWQPGTSVARLRPDIPFGVLALAAGGVPTHASEGRSQASERKEGDTTQTLQLVFPDVTELPERLSVEALVRTGTPQALHFQLPSVPLPDDRAPAPVSNPPGEVAESGGGSLRASVRAGGRPAGAGALSLGLSPAAPAPPAWRWVTLLTDGGGSATAAHLKPGRYRVRARWTPAPSSAAPAGRWTDEWEVTITEGKAAVLPPLEVGP